MRIVHPLFASLLASGVLSAQQLITPTGASQAGAPDFGAWGGTALHVNVVNDSGLSAIPDFSNYTTVTHAAASPGTAWTTDAPGADYFAAGGAPAVWTLTLDQVYPLTDLVFWGYHFGGANGNESNVFQLEFSEDGGAIFSAPITVSIPLGAHAVGNAVTLSFGDTFLANIVRLTITDNQFGGGAAGGDRLGVGEFKFIAELPPRDPSIEVDPTSVTVSSNGAVVPVSLDVTNEGASQPLTISSVTPGGLDAGFITNISFPGTVAAGATAQITFDVDSGGLSGPVDANVVIESDDSVFPTVTVPVTGSVRDPWGTAPGPVDHGPVPNDGPLQDIEVTVFNVGANNDLEVIDAFFLRDPTGSFAVLTDFTDALFIGPDGELQIDVTFDPAGLHGGVYSGTLAIALGNDPEVFDLLVDINVMVETAGDTLVAWWPLDADSGDASGNGHDGIDVGFFTYGTDAGATANTGTALNFTGPDRIDIPQDEAINRDAFTFVAWANPATASGGYNSVVTSRYDQHAASTNTYGFILYNSAGGNWEFWTGTDSGSANPWEVTTQGGGDVVIGAWVHLALTYDATTGEKILYKDGVPAATGNVTNFQPNLVTDLHLGGGGDNGDQFGYQGLLDDVAIWCEVLSEADINTIKDEGVAGFLGGGPQRIDLSVVGYDQDLDALTVRVADVPGGGASNFHLRISSDGQTFSPVPASDFTADTDVVLGPLSPDIFPTVLVQAFEGPASP